MANPTSNFGWQMPTPTDLVTDLPADFEVFGQAVDTSLADLKGGTSGQVLSKNSNTDMDFVWVTSDDANAIQNTIVDAKGDLIAATAADTPARLAVGTNDFFLQAASGESTGLKWGGEYSYYTPTFSATSGTLTSTSYQGFRYLKIGKMVHLNGRVNIINKGTASGQLIVTLPFTAAAIVDQMGTAEEIGSVGLSCFCLVNAGSSTMSILQSNYGTVITNGYGISFSLTYEVA
jgi:hypothetical protein